MRTKDAGSALWTIVAIVVAVAVLAGIAYYVMNGPPKEVPRKEEIHLPTKESERLDGIRITIPDGSSGELRWKEEVVQSTGDDPVVEAVNRFLIKSNIAPDARLVKATRDGKNLKLNFSGLFGRGYGTDNEGILLEGIMLAVKKNSDAETVEFFEDGSPAQGLGNLELEGPQPVLR
jgi:hypothetical protein